MWKKKRRSCEVSFFILVYWIVYLAVCFFNASCDGAFQIVGDKGPSALGNKGNQGGNWAVRHEERKMREGAVEERKEEKKTIGNFFFSFFLPFFFFNSFFVQFFLRSFAMGVGQDTSEVRSGFSPFLSFPIYLLSSENSPIFSLPLHSHDLPVHLLENYLVAHLPNFIRPLTVRQFKVGQSNPTFLVLDGSNHRYVVRKKPSGKLVATAHMIEREFQVLKALKATDFPVPKVFVYCEDLAVIGTPFYVPFFCSFVGGLVVISFWDFGR